MDDERLIPQFDAGPDLTRGEALIVTFALFVCLLAIGACIAFAVKFAVWLIWR